MKVKICGITSIEDARACVEAGADCIGLNFYPGSPRAIAAEQARAIAAELTGKGEPVGLFVNAPAKEIREVCAAAALRSVQLHGDEAPELLAELADFTIIRAFRCGEHGLAPLEHYLERCRKLGRPPDYVLIDAHRPDRYGGTGESPPWELVAREYRRHDWPPLLLAGGLTPANVAEAVRVVWPFGVDTASGVESSPGRKDRERVRAFVRAVRDATAERPPARSKPL